LTASHLCRASMQRMAPWGEGRWSRDAQLFCASDKGGWVDLRLPVEKSGFYRIDLYATRAPDFGKFQVSMGSKPLGPVIDGYGQQVQPTGPIRLGTVRLEAGKVTLRFEVLDKNAASTGYAFGIDCLDFVRKEMRVATATTASRTAALARIRPGHKAVLLAQAVRHGATISANLKPFLR